MALMLKFGYFCNFARHFNLKTPNLWHQKIGYWRWM